MIIAIFAVSTLNYLINVEDIINVKAVKMKTIEACIRSYCKKATVFKGNNHFMGILATKIVYVKRQQ